MSSFANELRELRCNDFVVPVVEGHPKVTLSVQSNKNRMLVERVDAKVVTSILEIFKQEYLNGAGSITLTGDVCSHFADYGDQACHSGYTVEWSLADGNIGRFDVYMVGVMGISRICVAPKFGNAYVSEVAWHSIPHLKRFLKSSILKLVRKRHYMFPES